MLDFYIFVSCFPFAVAAAIAAFPHIHNALAMRVATTQAQARPMAPAGRFETLAHIGRRHWRNATEGMRGRQ